MTVKSTLEEIQTYKNDAVVLRFQETWDLPLEECHDIFTETLKWLWLCHYNAAQEQPIPLAISQSTKLIDEMWHTFILFTSEYASFCDTHFGSYIHHRPTSRKVYDETIREYEKNPDSVMDRNKDLFTKQYELIYDVLGEPTLIKWYSEYLDKYTDEYMRTIWRWSFSPYDTRVRDSVRLAPSEESLSPSEESLAAS